MLRIRNLEIRRIYVKRTYAAVFPDPVFALAKISFPSRAKGMAFSCKQYQSKYMIME